MLRIGIVCHPTYGGSGVVASELGLALADRGNEVHFISHELPFRVPDAHPNTNFHRVDVTSYPLFKYPPYALALASKLFEICGSRRFDVLHVHYAIPHAIAAYLAAQMLGDKSPKVVTTLHGTDITLIGLDSSFFEITRFGIEQSDVVTAVSHYLAEETRKRFEPKKDIAIVPNFIDLDEFKPDLRSDELRARHAQPGERIIGHLSNFRSVKRIPDVIRTFHLLQKKLPARLLMIGEGVELEPARHQATELGILDRVSFLGPVADIPAILAQLDLFLLPSEYESFGLAALEAMACGVPVVSSLAGGIPECVVDGETGILCAVGDYACMAASALSILQNEARWQGMRQAARHHAETRFSAAEVVTQYEDLYARLVEG